MIHFELTTLPNGLRVIAHEDNTTGMAAVNILYKVGSRDEHEDHTGFAHLFEHFMFEGSVNIPHFDTPLQYAGGENNAFTTTDFTNYYELLPSKNIETALWLESDRMLSLAFDDALLEVQKNVVMEEFKEYYINQPYGDVWHRLVGLSYQVHPYRWPVIGKSLEHIAQVKLQEAKDFFYKYYRPNNAILSIAGPLRAPEVFQLAEKWFGDISPGQPVERNIPAEPPQTEPRFLEVRAKVPVNAIYKAYKMCARTDTGFYAADLIRDLLSNGESSRLYQQLVKEKKMFSIISAYLTETVDEGLFVIEGKISDGVSMDDADRAITSVTDTLIHDAVSDRELAKVKNKIESYITFSEVNILNRAMNLAYYDMLGDPDGVNKEAEKYKAVTSMQIQEASARIFSPKVCSTIYYFAEK
ncbi:MAG: insulinase family protein [Chitinophagales bacterium]|nr:insulinase family protein [Chitinophagales bacterium]MDW8419626.1 pitrilysin family protein [Chitinophagales bacterium]